MKLFNIILFFFLSGNLFSQEMFSVFLVGDAGKDTSTNNLLSALKNEIGNAPKSAIVFLGDNIYPKGFLKKKNKKHELEKKRLLAQLNILNEYKGSVFFVPGNHDWRIGKRSGKKAVSQQCEFVNLWIYNNSQVKNKNSGCFFPQKGSPGPVSEMLTEKLRLIIIDTQWWLQPFEANKYEKNFFLMQLDSLLSVAKINNDRVIVAAHHPIFTNGRHAKNRQPARFLVSYTPLQIFGLLGLNRLFSQDLPQPKYQKMRNSLLLLFEKYEGLIYAAGHEHNLQLFKNQDDFFIVSGSGSKVSKLSENKFPSVFNYDSGLGFFRIDFFSDGKMQLSAFTEKNGKAEKIYSTQF